MDATIVIPFLRQGIGMHKYMATFLIKGLLIKEQEKNNLELFFRI